MAKGAGGTEDIRLRVARSARAAVWPCPTWTSISYKRARKTLGRLLFFK